MSEHDAPIVPARDYRPVERFWPYVDLPEQPTDEELAALDPDLAEALFGRRPLPFSVSLEFPAFPGPEYDVALEQARRSAEYRQIRRGDSVRHRARFYPEQVIALRELFHIVGRVEGCEVLVDDRPVPYARELWLPLLWCLIR
jgi:hypothetical protein